MDKDRTWTEVDEILVLLDNATDFLDFPSDQELAKHKLVENKGKLVKQQDLELLKKATE